MAVFSITHEQRIDDYGCITLLTAAPLSVGQSVTLTGLNHGLNGTQIIADLSNSLFLGVDQYGQFIYNPSISIPNQVVFYDAGADVTRAVVSPYGTLTTGVCTWIDDDDIADWLNIGQASAADAAFLADCANASNQFCYRRRFEAGYVDSLTTVPSQDVRLGCVMYGGALYRARGSMDQFASFSDMGVAPTVGISPIIKQLLGVDRPAVA
jgi:hypothetical protein